MLSAQKLTRGSFLAAKLQRRCRVLCEREGEAKDCSALLESCVGAHKVRHAQKLQALPSALPADHEAAPITQVYHSKLPHFAAI